MKTVEEIYGYKSDPKVLKFIDEFINCSTQNEEEREVICKTFTNGYCYYFAVMLKEAFGRGAVCWAAPHSHMAWVDTNGCPYDIEGVCATETDYFIPVHYMGHHLQGFMHVDPDEPFYMDTVDMVNIMRAYEDDMGLPPAKLSIPDGIEEVHTFIPETE